MGWQQTIIVGNVGRVDDPRTTQSGTPVFSFSVAVTEKWNDRTTNQRQEKTTWYRVTCWRQLAETMAQYVSVGTQVMVIGSVEADAYMNKDNEPAASLKLTAREVQLLGSRGEQASGGENDYRGGMEHNDDIPFFRSEI